MTRRIVVAGGAGFFGAAVVALLRGRGIDPIVASRGGNLRLDVEQASSIRAALHEGDVVVDAAGPFQVRSDLLARLADEVGYDVVDLSDALDHAERILALRPTRARLLTACSSVSAVTAALVARSGIARPTRVEAFLVPEATASARPGAAMSMLRSVGRPIRALRGGRLVRTVGWSGVRRLDAGPLGRLEGREMETADAVTLPRVWPTLREVAMHVDMRMPWLNRAFDLAAAWGLAVAMERPRLLAAALSAVRLVAPRGSGYLIEVEGEGRVRRLGLVAERDGFVVAAMPAAIAAEEIACGRFTGEGVIAADRLVDADLLLARLADRGVRLVELG